MSLYLDEDMMGGDDDLLAFPNLLLCMGLVCCTADKMYGIHLTNLGRSAKVVPAFAGWLSDQGVKGAAVTRLYGSANFTTRYGELGDLASGWKAEMTGIAAAVGYKGTVRGFDSAVLVPKGGLYLEYRSDILKASYQLLYKENDKMNYTNGAADTGATAFAKQSFYTGDVTLTAIKGDAKTGASVKTFRGDLKEVDYTLRLSSFEVR